ncbi:MAG: glycerate kinase, partial [Clostridiaceae bacterium]
PLVGDEKDPTRTTTYGVGELMRHALENGAVRLILALGGSATNDGGCGAAAAMGTRFFDADGKEFIPTGGTLDKIARIDNAATTRLLAGVEVVAMCDIDNPMHGERGAAYVFAPQKGADAEMVRLLDAGLISLDKTLVRELGASVAEVPGAGAAGAMGAGAVAFFGARLNPGIETVLDTVRFEERIAGADFVITGEGKLDSQSLRGKVVIGVARRAKRAGVPVFAVVGDVADDIDEAYAVGVTAIFSTNHLAIPFSEAKARSAKDYRLTIENLFRALAALQ